MEEYHVSSEHSQTLQTNCKFYYQLILSVTASLASFLDGCSTGSMSDINKKIKHNELPFPTSTDNITTLTNLASWSSLLGPILFTYFINRFGRKNTLVILIIFPTVNYLILIVATDITHVIFAVCLAFVPILMIPSVASVYISEVTAPHLRGAMNNFSMISFYVGLAFSSSISWPFTLRTNGLILGSVCFLVLLFICFLPESPYYYIRMNQPTRAKKVLKRLYNEDVSNLELIRLQRHVNQVIVKPIGIQEVLFKRKYRRVLLIIMNLFFLKYNSGSIIFVWFSAMLLSDAKYKYLSPYICQNIILVSGIVFTVVNSLFLRYFYRKTIGIFSYTLTGVCLGLLALYYYFVENNCEFLENLPDFLPFGLFLLFKASVSFGVVGLPYVYLRELIQIEVLAYSTLILDFSVPVFKAFSVFCFNYLRTHYSYSTAFGFFFGCVLFGGVIFVVFTPETKDKLLEET